MPLVSSQEINENHLTRRYDRRDLRTQDRRIWTASTGFKIIHNSSIYNEDQDSGINELGEDKNSLKAIPNTALPSTEDGRDEATFVPNFSKIRDIQNKRRVPLPLKFSSKKSTSNRVGWVVGTIPICKICYKYAHNSLSCKVNALLHSDVLKADYLVLVSNTSYRRDKLLIHFNTAEQLRNEIEKTNKN